MAKIEEIVEHAPNTISTIDSLQCSPDLVSHIFKPLIDCGFNDFVWRGGGRTSFCVSPADNDKIVFRISMEKDARPENIPFFLQAGYTKSFDVEDDYVPDGFLRVEVLLAGEMDESTGKARALNDSEKDFLLKEMRAAGWRISEIDLDRLWEETVVVPIRDKGGRMRIVPLIQDPSALTAYLPLKSRPANLNVCTSNYVTLQDQAAAYNALRESDSRLKKFIPVPVKFPETTIIDPLAVDSRIEL